MASTRGHHDSEPAPIAKRRRFQHRAQPTDAASAKPEGQAGPGIRNTDATRVVTLIQFNFTVSNTLGTHWTPIAERRRARFAEASLLNA